MNIILSHYQLESIYPTGSEKYILLSTDLGQTVSEVLLNKEGIRFSEDISVNWDQINRIQMDHNGCFLVQPSGLERIKFFSERTNHSISLFPTLSAPTMLISGIPMHRIKETDPWKDTLQKIQAFDGISGSLLDTNTGLGYTAIAASQYATWILSIEIDPAVISIGRLNPWSKSFFTEPRISSLIGDSFEIVFGILNNSFDNILHDPPTFSLAGNLYSAEFYTELFRILKPYGKLFHYIGNPDSKTGATVTRSVMQRLRSVGFSKIIEKPKAFGLLAIKA